MFICSACVFGQFDYDILQTSLQYSYVLYTHANLNIKIVDVAVSSRVRHCVRGERMSIHVLLHQCQRRLLES